MHISIIRFKYKELIIAGLIVIKNIILKYRELLWVFGFSITFENRKIVFLLD